MGQSGPDKTGRVELSLSLNGLDRIIMHQLVQKNPDRTHPLTNLIVRDSIIS